MTMCDCGRVEVKPGERRLQPYAKVAQKPGVATAIRHGELGCYKVDYLGLNLERLKKRRTRNR